MNTSFVISINSNSSYTQRLVINLEGKANLKRSEKYVVCTNITIYWTWKNIKKKHIQFTLLRPKWVKVFEFPDGSNSISDVQDSSDYVTKKTEKPIDNFLIQVYMNKNIFEIKSRYYVQSYLLIKWKKKK